MNQMEQALYRAGAHIAFKENDLEEVRLPLKKWKTPRLPGYQAAGTSKQRIISGIAREPIDRTAALVTSRKPKMS